MSNGGAPTLASVLISENFLTYIKCEVHIMGYGMGHSWLK